MNVLSVCSGVGGLDLGVKLAVPDARTACYVEAEVFAAAVLASRIADGLLCDAPIWSDLKTFDPAPWRGRIDAVVGGIPCQPFSNAGKRKGSDDDRYLWPLARRLIEDLAPEWVFIENVAGMLSLGFEAAANDLQGMGYRVAAGLFTAAEVGASHKRERLFVLARRRLDDADVVGSELLRERGREPDGGEEGRSTAAQRRRDHGDGGVVLADAADCGGTIESRGDGEGAGGGRALVYAVDSPNGGVVDGDSPAGVPRRLGIERRVGEALRDERSGASSHGPERRQRDGGELGVALGDADDTRLEGRREPECGGADELVARASGPAGDGVAGLPLWPPGPADRERWRRVLRERPDLAPAVADAGGERRPEDVGSSPRHEAADGRAGRDRGEPDGDHEPDRDGEGGSAVADGSEHEGDDGCGGSRDDGRGGVDASPRPRSCRASASESEFHRLAARSAAGLDDPVPAGIRVDRLRAGGNAVVPLAAAYAWRTLATALVD